MKLSVCVATFNRAAFIAQTLEAIARELSDDAELVVVDGGSTDRTASVMADFVQRHPRTVYRRESVNSGLDQDFDKAVRYASGEYCWLMSDDDLLVPGALTSVLAQLEAGPDLLVVNAEIWSRDLTFRLKERQLEVHTDRTYGPQDQHRLLADAGAYLSFIGGIVVRRAVWLAREREPYFGTLFVHVGVLFQRPPLASAAIIARPLVRIRYGNASWSSRSFEIWTRKWPGLVWSFPHLPDAAKARVTPRDPAGSFRTLLWYRALDAYGPVEWNALRAHAHHRLAAAIAYIPARVANAALAVYLLVRRDGNAPMMLYDLMRAKPAGPVTRWVARRMGFADSGP